MKRAAGTREDPVVIDGDTEDEGAGPSERPRKAHQPARSKNWCVTVFDGAVTFVAEWSVKDLPPNVVYCVGQLEMAPDTGRVHAQCFFQLTNQMSLAPFKRFINRVNAHCEIMRGTPQQAADYCKKAETRYVPEDGSTNAFERGELKQQGKRTDLEAVAQEILAGHSLEKVATENPAVFTRYHGGLKALQLATQKPASRPRPKIYYFYGPPGSGKSKLAFEKWSGAYVANDTREGWFDGYQQEETIIFDDFEGHFPAHYMKRLLDFNPLRLPVKGGWTTIKAHTIVFTSNSHPTMLYGGCGAWASRILNGARYGTEVYKMEAQVAANQEAQPAPGEEQWLPIRVIDPAHTM